MTLRWVWCVAGVAGWMISGWLQIAGGETAEERTWTSRADQKTMQAEYVGLANGKVSLRLANKKQTQVPLDKLADDDQQYVKSQLGKLREWTAAKSGKKATAQFVQLTDDGRVELLLEDLKSCWLSRASLVAADQKYLDTEAPIPLLRRLPGTWTGFSTGGGAQLVHRMEILVVGGKLQAEHLIYQGLTDEELAMAQKGSLKPAMPLLVTAFVVKCESAITIEGDQISFDFGQGAPVFFATKKQFEKREWLPFKVQGSCPQVGLIVAKSVELKAEDEAAYYFTKVGAFDNAQPTDLERGKTHQRTSSIDTNSHYSLYIPKSYRPDKPAPLLINDSAGGSAQPLSTQAAEEHGWICIGLKESRNGIPWKSCDVNCHTALLDVRHMLNIHPQRYYFSGLSGGARRAAERALFYPSNTAGVICMAAGFAQWSKGELSGYYRMPALKVAAFMIVGGQADMNHSEVCDTVFPALKQQKRACQLIVHPGGHDWGRPADHLAAIRWLEQQWKTPGN